MADAGTTENDEATPPECIKREPFERNLRVILGPEQVAERADRVAHLLHERDHKEEMAKAALAHAKSEIKEVDAQLHRLASEVRDKACYLETKCERIFDYHTGAVTETRLDTGEVISERPMTADERQIELPPQPPAPAAGPGNGSGGGSLEEDFQRDGESGAGSGV
jgi:hypothetical protein